MDHPSHKVPRDSMTMVQVADRLAKFLTPQSLIVEWSTSFCDYRYLFKALRAIGRETMMPPKRHVFRLNIAWRLALSSFKLFLRLSDLYRMLFPDDISLADQAHRAEPDVRMMYNLVVAYFRGTLKPAFRSKITQYLSQRQQKVPLMENTLSPALAGFIEQIDLVDSTESQFRKQILKSAGSHENKDLKEFVATGTDQLYMDAKIRGDQGIALEGNKDIEHDVDIEDDDNTGEDDNMEYYDNMEDYDEIVNGYSCDDEDIYEDENEDVDMEL
jgi:hypothetical protein